MYVVTLNVMLIVKLFVHVSYMMLSCPIFPGIADQLDEHVVTTWCRGQMHWSQHSWRL